MDLKSIIVIALGVVIVIGGIFASNYATKISHKEASETNKNKK